MNNKEYISAVAERTGYSSAQVGRMLRVMVESMAKSFEEGNAVTINGFGTFETKTRMEREMVNPSTGGRMLVPPKIVLNFRPSTAIKEKLKQQ